MYVFAVQGWNGFAYVYDGEGKICGTKATPEHVSGLSGKGEVKTIICNPWEHHSGQLLLAIGGR